MPNWNTLTLLLILAGPVSAQEPKPTESNLAHAMRTGKPIPTQITSLPPHALSFVTRDGNSKKIISCGPLAISADGDKHFLGLNNVAAHGVTAPAPLACKATILSRSGDSLRVKIDATRSLSVDASKDNTTWVTQNHSTIRDIAIGESATIKFAADVSSRTAPLDLTIRTYKMDTFLAIKDVNEFAKP